MIPPTCHGVRSDAMGDGHFGARRGDRTHKGTDWICYPGEPIVAPIYGKVVREAKPYSNDMHYNGVLIRNSIYSIKMFYCDPYFNIIGQYVRCGDPIGVAQDISKKYEGPGKPAMTPHIHTQVEDNNGNLIDPETILEEVTRKFI